MAAPLLEVIDLKTHFFLDDGVVRAVDGVDFTLEPGKTLCIVGESGCGKSVTAHTLMQLIPMPPGKIVGGKMLYRGGTEEVDLALLNPRSAQMRAIRGGEIGMIFQEPMTSLSPVHTVGSQICEVVRLHRGVGAAEAKSLAIEMLNRVKVPRPAQVFDSYPHQLSGGMRQRAMIARALSCRPKILIADEPTTALDVTVQAQILSLLRELQEQLGMALILITHNLGVVAQIADDVAVFYLGRVVEQGGVNEVFETPSHPYTRALFASMPRLGMREKLKPITGSVPDPLTLVQGCPFRDRCPERHSRCEGDEVPELYRIATGQRSRCYLHEHAGEPGHE